MSHWCDQSFAELLSRAVREFSNVRYAEEQLLRAVTTGEVAFCGRQPGTRGASLLNDPDFADSWGDSRRVGAQLIRWLCVAPDVAQYIDPRGIQLNAAVILGKLDLSHTRILFPLRCRNCYFTDPPVLSYAQLEHLDLSHSLTPGIIADGVAIRRDLLLRDGFRARGQVTFLSAAVGGNIELSGGKFFSRSGPCIQGDQVSVSGSIFLRNEPFDDEIPNEFRAEGEVRLIAAKIAGELDCRGGIFTKGAAPKSRPYALSCDRMRVSGSVFLRRGFAAQGEVRLMGAEIGGDLKISGNRFSPATSVKAERATVKGVLEWKNRSGDHQGEQKEAKLDLTDARATGLEDDESSWPGKGNLQLNGFVYGHILSRPNDSGPNDSSPVDAKTRLRWLERQATVGHEFRPQPYQQLARVLRELGDNVGARRVLIAMENARSQRGNLNLFSRAWQRILRAGIGYGYRPWYALLWGIGIILLGTIIFLGGFNSGLVTPLDKEAFSSFRTHHPKLRSSNEPLYYPRFSAPIYSAETFIPLIKFGQEERWGPNAKLGSPMTGMFSWLTSGWLLQFYLWFHITAGWLLTTLFVAGLTPIIRSE